MLFSPFCPFPIHRPVSAIALALLAACVLPGCMAMSPGAAARLAAFDPLEANPAELRIAIEAPRQIEIRPGDLVMTILHPGTNGVEGLDEKFIAHMDGEIPAAPGIAAMADADRRIILASIAPADHVRVRSAQAQARAMKAAAGSAGKGHGSIAVGATGCRHGAFGPGPIRFSIYMQTRAGTAYFPLHENVDLRALLKNKGGVNAMPLCEAAGGDTGANRAKSQ